MAVTTEMWLFIGLGVFGGYFIGRFRAEYGRARRDVNAVWNGRSRYRS